MNFLNENTAKKEINNKIEKKEKPKTRFYYK